MSNKSDLANAPEERADGDFFPPGCAVRFIRPTDSEPVRTLFISTQNALVSDESELEVRIAHKKHTDAALMGDLKRASTYYTQPGRRMWVVESQEHEIVGMAAVDSDPEEESDIAVLRRLCVKQGFRDKGVATLLAQRAEQWAKMQGFKRMMLEVTELQCEGRQLSRKLEYADEGSTKHDVLTVFHMEKALQESA